MKRILERRCEASKVREKTSVLPITSAATRSSPRRQTVRPAAEEQRMDGSSPPATPTRGYALLRRDPAPNTPDERTASCLC